MEEKKSKDNDEKSEEEVEMARSTPLKKRTRKEQKAYFSKKDKYRPIKIYKYNFDSDKKRDPFKSFPKELKIKVPKKKPPLFKDIDLDRVIDDMFDKKIKKR
ncbi:MAG: hypothetical protein BV456_11345 [Thermoplasmata archaeon M8B2D]|nr:MAG: hypothetical protein BV456_11345 [Thermoplasmata archaeon M8B2D]